MALLVLLAVLGCRREAAIGESPAAEGREAKAPQAEARETWDLFYFQGAKVGYVRSRETPLVRDGRKLLEVEVFNRLMLKRFGQLNDQEMTLVSTETPDGQVLGFRTEMKVGPSPMSTVGQLVGDRMKIETTTAGNTTRMSLPWDQGIGGFLALEQSLARKPMQPGEKRTLRALLPMLNQMLVVTNQLQARDLESTRLPGGSYRLLRIESQVELPGGSRLDSLLWTDRSGDVVKTQTAALGQESYRTTKEVALEETEGGKFDLGYDTVVRLKRPLEHAHQTKKVRYRVHLDGSDPAAVFVSGPTQEVHSIDPHTAQITVIAIDPAQPAAAAQASADAPSAADREPNSFIQSNDPRIVAMAREAASGETDPARFALALEKYVRGHIKKKNFTQALATAAEVATSLEGDCTEHAMLLAALARAQGIPSRVAIGLVYVDGEQGFGYHMWNECYLNGRWVPLDATLAQGGTGAAHLKLAHSNLKEASALVCFLPVAQVLGRLKIEVLQAE